MSMTGDVSDPSDRGRAEPAGPGAAGDGLAGGGEPARRAGADADPRARGPGECRPAPSGRGLPVQLLLAPPRTAAALASRCAGGAGRTRRSAPAGGSTAPSAARPRDPRPWPWISRRSAPRVGAQLDFTVRMLLGHRRRARPVRLLRSARVGDGVPAGCRRAAARGLAAAARAAAAPTTWCAITRSGARHYDAFRFFTPEARPRNTDAAGPGVPPRPWNSRVACMPGWTSTSGPTR